MEADLEDAALLAFKRGRAMSSRLQVSLEAGKGKETDSPLEPPEETSPAKHLELSPLRLTLDF